MKKNNVLKFFEEIEAKDPVLKKWGDLIKKEEEIIDKIVSARKKRNISQKELAKMTGLKQPAIARIENKINSPQLDTLLKIVDALDLTFDIKDIEEHNGIENEKILNINEHYEYKYIVNITQVFDQVYKPIVKEDNNEYSPITNQSQEIKLAC